MIYRIAIIDESHSQSVQKQLFANGCRWVAHGQTIREIETNVIYIHNKEMSVHRYHWGKEGQTIKAVTLSEYLQEA